MATNRVRWIRNLLGAPEPLVMLGKFQAGATQAIKRGELLELSGSGTTWVPLDSDFAMHGDIAIANEEIKSGDRAGYFEIMVPRPGDVFEYALASAAATAAGAALYYSDSETITTSGSNILGRAVGQEHYPDKQGHLADDASGDAGTTIRSTAYIRMMIDAQASYFSALQAVKEADNPVGGLYSALYGATPFIVQTTLTAGGAEDETIMASWPVKARVVRAWMVSRDTNAANVTLKNATNAFTDTKAKGTTDDALVEFAKIIAEYDEIAAAAAVIATFSAAGSVDVCLLCIPIP